ncbi:ribosome biogenesis GTP-binding protein YihA/YsxC [Acetivibrio saccincola]|jgi:GTP-binding protein|uniref:Probable GTP-binding protein EngB n=1 Tax=Acetivibrio saccincola TaxID=1677857 RepID=A0A2S8RBX5_9FIRM|nr:ribosome biogenesis GTP-binding protein YihA/YsxC [Acetivibrio saccincola]PQQ67296.1 YihA family ribosome biogenesis GTP-binding protein [Acetivibrio saccincola]HOA97483.1 ribosome biogenesis GTP-binding protein YihA/YsxC [Acetivibrio saccincola]HQD28598.1 ribosome biogenesis GTP-binding protein YihA/YsxC [Acetivibrio saccincola]
MSLNINNAKYELSAVKPSQYPVSDLPEVTFVGRSNVGKSSLINSLLNRKNLAKVAATPGKTQVINFYNIDNKLYFVDLPGYGYAKVSKGVQASWAKFIETYLVKREQLKLIVMLVDIRHSPTSHDKLMHDWILSMELPYLVVATKKDKVPRSKIKPRLADIAKELNLDASNKLIPYSSETRQGRDELWDEIKKCLDMEG